MPSNRLSPFEAFAFQKSAILIAAGCSAGMCGLVRNPFLDPTPRHTPAAPNPQRRKLAPRTEGSTALVRGGNVGWSFARSEQSHRQRVDTPRHDGRETIVDQAVPLNPR